MNQTPYVRISWSIDGLHGGGGFISRGQESGSVFSTAVCKMQVSAILSLYPLVLKDKKKSCFSQGERFAVPAS